MKFDLPGDWLSAGVCESTAEGVGETYDAAHAGKVLVAVGPGDAMVLVADVAPGAHWLDEFGVREDGFACEENGIDVACGEQGLFIGNLAVVDDGPGDWPGTRECAVVINELRPVTAAEWKAHCRGEWPWSRGS